MNELTHWFLVFARVGALVAALPIFSMQNFPMQVRTGLCALLAFLITPFVPTPSLGPLGLWPLIYLLAKEVSVGLLLGFVCRLVFYALEAAGTIMATDMGLMMSSEFNQLSGTATAAPGVLLYWMAIMLWLSLDLHHWLIVAVQRSYALAPIGAAHLSQALLLDIIKRTTALFTLAVQIAAPIIGVSFVISLVFSMLGRAVPQMNVFAESFSVRPLAGLLVFGFSCLFMAHHILNYLRRLPEDALRVAQLLATG